MKGNFLQKEKDKIPNQKRRHQKTKSFPIPLVKIMFTRRNVLKIKNSTFT